MRGLSTGLRALIGKGSCLIIIYAESEDGFANGALEFFNREKK